MVSQLSAILFLSRRLRTTLIHDLDSYQPFFQSMCYDILNNNAQTDRAGAGMY